MSCPGPRRSLSDSAICINPRSAHPCYPSVRQVNLHSVVSHSSTDSISTEMLTVLRRHYVGRLVVAVLIEVERLGVRPIDLLIRLDPIDVDHGIEGDLQQPSLAASMLIDALPASWLLLMNKSKNACHAC